MNIPSHNQTNQHPKQKCSVCLDDQSSFFCSSCVNVFIHKLRAEWQEGWTAKQENEHEIDSILLHLQSQERPKIEKERNRLRCRVLEKLINTENAALQKSWQDAKKLRVENNTRRYEITGALALLAKQQRQLSIISNKTPLLSQHTYSLSNMLSKTQCELLEMLGELYPITKLGGEISEYCGFAIVGIPLLDDLQYIINNPSRQLSLKYFTQFDIRDIVSAALGYCILLLQLICKYLYLSLPFSMQYQQSRSTITSNDLEERHDNNFHDDDGINEHKHGCQELPLYFPANEFFPMGPKRFARALRLLDINVKYVCVHAGVRPNLLRSNQVLHNLFTLMQSFQNRKELNNAAVPIERKEETNSLNSESDLNEWNVI